MVQAHEWDVSRRLARPPGRRRPWWVSHPAPEPAALRLEWEASGGRTRVVVEGDVDQATAPQLEAFVAARPLAGCAVLELDLGGVPSIGSGGLSVLIALRRRCQQRGIDLVLRNAQPSVWRVFEATGLDGVFTASGPAPCPPAQDLALF
ncbi:STAS domain-containing protein [Blastococcus sp. VKM Ac-2987]|uniref:STAS domain-containing protein n=1 Tax=Blastococcus sp. VKM Ac-2987 TaxID=3004141 RepID=UPI0022AB84DA|nr:STAS domain-containing protein [Blastococcus sp. VKM Ac-2987]MCZ2859008.1 STAS domain-containing protein [Blastococcus sp. VKM Ac-2987]